MLDEQRAVNDFRSSRQFAATFPRTARLLSADQYRDIFKSGRSLRRDSPVRVRILENSGNSARIGVIVPKKGNRLAVRRNRIKRLVRDYFRLTRTHLKSVDIIVHVTGAVADEDLMRILRQSMKSLIEEQSC